MILGHAIIIIVIEPQCGNSRAEAIQPVPQCTTRNTKKHAEIVT